VIDTSTLSNPIMKASDGYFWDSFFFRASCRLRRKHWRSAAAKDVEPV
jgi:hypothetical protein